MIQGSALTLVHSDDKGQHELLPEDLQLQVADPYFAPDLNAWIVTKYADVGLLLQDLRFQISFADVNTLASAIPETRGSVQSRHSHVLAGADAFFDRIRPQLGTVLKAASSQTGKRDLLTDVIRPACLELARIGLGCAIPSECVELAGFVFRSSAYPYDVELRAAAATAQRELIALLPGQAAGLVQLFIAVVTSVPAFVANALWLQHNQGTVVSDSAGAWKNTLEECLRLSCLPCLIFRRAAVDATLPGWSVRPGQLVILMLHAANRDPAHFANPAQLDIHCRRPPHLSFGRGPHGCVGARLVRLIGLAFLQCLQGLEISNSTSLAWKGVGSRYLESFPMAEASHKT